MAYAMRSLDLRWWRARTRSCTRACMTPGLRMTSRAAVDLFPGDKAMVFDPLVANLGYDPNDR